MKPTCRRSCLTFAHPHNWEEPTIVVRPASAVTSSEDGRGTTPVRRSLTYAPIPRVVSGLTPQPAQQNGLATRGDAGVNRMRCCDPIYNEQSWHTRTCRACEVASCDSDRHHDRRNKGTSPIAHILSRATPLPPHSSALNVMAPALKSRDRSG
ncbi:unnamed protein product [Schistocephalus solidus]|uniref:Uncharacterized protein n=1 Tax=Schistocephalus solidus TaxID=70667 RepID=A0A183SBF9_SCHSO|nr:unnamed protein product [Schistocephalus solidus]